MNVQIHNCISGLLASILIRNGSRPKTHQYMRMFDIFYTNLSHNTVQSEQGGIRPAIIIQNDIGNKYSPTVIVLPITSEIKKESLPTHCILHKSSKNGLEMDSMVLAEQIRVIDKSRLLDKLDI